jgi:hypothetical protein
MTESRNSGTTSVDRCYTTARYTHSGDNEYTHSNRTVGGSISNLQQLLPHFRVKILKINLHFYSKGSVIYLFSYVLFNDAFSSSDIICFELLGMRAMNWKGHESKWSLANLMYCSGICRQGLKITVTNLSG